MPANPLRCEDGIDASKSLNDLKYIFTRHSTDQSPAGDDAAIEVVSAYVEVALAGGVVY